jgi:hypothetical protein
MKILIGDEIKKILNLINYSKYKKITTKRIEMKLKKPFNFIKYFKFKKL